MSENSDSTLSTANQSSARDTNQEGAESTTQKSLSVSSEGTETPLPDCLTVSFKGAKSSSQSHSGSQSGLPVPPVQPANSGADTGWNFDGMEDKNPFSGMSEEHLNKLDEVLSSVNVQELLQQTNPEFHLLNLDGTEQLSGATGSSMSERRDSSDSLPESIVSVVFSDHGYCLNPEKAGKVKPIIPQTAAKSPNVLVAVEPSADDISVGSFPTALNMSADSASDTDQTDTKTESPYSSPRKSGRAHTKSKYLDEEWITQSPSKGRGRGRGGTSPVVTPFGFRASTRISDQKQRDLAEKIMLANRQAMQAEKSGTEDTDPNVSQSPQKTKPMGKGKVNPGKKSPGKSSQEDDGSGEESGEETEDREEDDKDLEEDDKEMGSEEEEIVEKSPKKVKGKVGKKKKGGKYEEDSDYSDVTDGKNKKKTKGKKKGKKDADSETETVVSKGKKGKKKKLLKGKKKGKEKGGKKLKGKGAKVDKDANDADESGEENESKTEAKEKSPKKSNKKLTKKERLKKLKEAKAAKKAKLLEKKKDKKKDKKKGKEETTEKASPTKTKTLPKGKVVGVKKRVGTEDESTDTSPKKKKSKAAEQKSPKAAEKRKASPARAAKLKAESESPAKKPKLTRQQLAKRKKTDITDSEDDKPLASVQKENNDTKPGPVLQQMSSPRKGEMNIFANLSVSLGTDPSTSEHLTTETGKKSGETLKTGIEDKKVGIKESDNKESVNDSGIEKMDVQDTLKGKVKKTQDKEADKSVESVKDIPNKVHSTVDSKESVVDGGADKIKDSDDSKKRHESEDSGKSHHHHHHRHRTHSKDSVNEEKAESGSQSHKRDSRDRRDSQIHRELSERRHSHDRKESHSSDRDRKSSKSQSDKDRNSRKSLDSSERRDSSKGRKESSSDVKVDSKKSSSVKDHRESTSSVSSSTSNGKISKVGVGPKKIGKDGKSKLKKSKKNDEMNVDSSMIDLFKPDNLPVVIKEESEAKPVNINDKSKEIPEEKERVSRVKFLDTSDTSAKEKVNTEKEAVIAPEVIKLDSVKVSSEDTEIEKDEKGETSVEVKDTDDSSETLGKTTKEEEIEIEVDANTEQSLKEKEVLGIRNVENSSEINEGNKSNEDSGNVEIESDAIGNDKSAKSDVTDEMKKEKIETSSENVAAGRSEEVKNDASSDVKKEINKPKKPLRMSDFFSERRLKINDPKSRQKVVDEVEVNEEAVAEASSGRQRRNKNVAFAEILKKEKLGSDDEEQSEQEYEDDENDEDFEDPDQLYCTCRQPHNQRFMICCDKCEEWFHGSCVGITKARGAEMEKDNEEYICPSCKEGAIQDGSVVSTTQSPELPNKKSQGAGKSKANEKSIKEDSKSIKPDSTVDRDSSVQVKNQEETPKSKQTTSKSQGEAKPQSEGSQTSKSKTELKSTPKVKSTKGQVTPKSEGKSKEKEGSSVKKRDLVEKRKRVIQMVKEETETKDKPKQPYNKCFSCNSRPPRRDSLYCSDECRQKHAKHNVVPGILKVTVAKETKKSKEKHIAVVDKSTGRTLTGEKAPVESELKSWLQENPSYEILKSHHKLNPKPLSLSSSDKKSEEKDSSSTSRSEKSSKSEKNKGPEPIRLNVRKGLRDALAARADAADDIMLSNSEIKGLVMSIEEELFKYFKDTDSKYKAKYRSLLFNIKDQKNNGLFRKILNRKIRASKLVRMSADELANKELAQWREHETKHTIEMIKQIETEHLNEPVHVMKKTHKGEEEVADEEGEDMSTLANEPKKSQELPKQEQNLTDEVNDEMDTTESHGQHLFDANCKICTGKLVPTIESTPTKSTASSSDSNVAIEKELTKSQHDLKADEVVKEVLKAIQRAKEDERKEQQRSSVTVRSPDSALSSGLDKNVKFTPIGPTLWKGFIYMQDVSKFVTTAYRVTGTADHLTLPDTITLCGRISPEHVWDYLSKVKQSATRDICVIRFIPGINEEKVAYINLYSYLNSRSRCGVIEHNAKNIKDFYIVPLASHSKIPSVLKPFDGPGLEENRCHMLLGVIIRNKVKRSSHSSDHSRSSSSSDRSKSSHSHHSRHSKSQPLKSALKNLDDTPDKSSESSTPRTSSSSSTPQTTSTAEKKSISFDPIVKEYSHVTEQEMAIEPVGDDPLDLNAPYDPEKEAMKEVAKPKKEKPQQDAVAKMIDNIALSKNPAEATAAMVAALATTSKLGNQRKLLMELTKKVDEQKRLLEQKRISSKLGQSPSGSSPGTSKSTSLGISSKDPRLRSQAAAQQVVDSAADAQDLDLRVKPGMSGPPGVGLVPASKSSVLPPSITASALENSVSILSSLTSDIASNVASPVKVSSTQSSDSPSNKSVSMTIQSHSQASVSVLTKDSAPDQTKRSETSKAVTPKGFYVDHAPVAKDHPKSSNNSKSDINSRVVVSDSVPKRSVDYQPELDSKSKSEKLGEKKSESTDKTSSEEQSDKSKTGMQHDIVTQLMAEVSGKSTDISVKTQSDIKDNKETESGNEPEQGSTKSNVPNVTELLKNLGSDKSDSGKKVGIQLPSALMSLFSKLPGSAEDPQEEKQTQIPGFFTSETEVTEDTDLRKSGAKQQGSLLPGLGDVESDEKQQLKLKDDNLSKSFMGFDYDSDSSGGSFEGFDDDGTKKLSPRKRKLVQKSVREISRKTNIFGDVDERPTAAADIDLREGNDVDLRQDTQTEVKDIDERVHMALAPSMDQPRPHGEGSRHTMLPPPGLRMSFMSSDQPPPPGEDWSHPTTTPMSVGMPGMHPQSVEWSHAPLPESQPPLPAEPPMPKPPEPPVKKKKWEDSNQFEEGSDNETEGRGQSKNSRKKKKKKAKKDKKGGSVTSDERLAQIILEIAKNEPKKPQQVSSVVPPPIPPVMPFVPPPQGMMPMVSMGVPMPPVPCAMPPSCPPIPGSMPLPTSGWMGDASMGAGLKVQSALQPPPMPAHLQPGVVPNPRLQGPHMDMNPSGIPSLLGPSHPNFPTKPPSLLDLPTLPPPAKLLANNPDKVKGSPLAEMTTSVELSSELSDGNFTQQVLETDDQVMEPSNQSGSSDRSRDVDDRSTERDRDERRRRDRHRSRSGDRSRRSRSGERSRRSRSGDRDSDHRRGRSRDYDRRRYDDRDRDGRHHGRDRDRWHRRH